MIIPTSSSNKTKGEVFVSKGRIVTIGWKEIEFIRKKALTNARKRARLCAHQSMNDRVHEMLIVLKKGVYIRPHRHNDKVESFHVVKGKLDVVIFDGKGKIKRVIKMGEYSSGRSFFYRIQDRLYHTVVVRSPYVVFHETTNGPFKPTQSGFAPWSPAEDNLKQVQRFLRRLK